MNKLTTPFGEICVTINGKIVDYVIEELHKERPYPDGSGYLFKVEGRYKITPCIGDSPTFPLKIKCQLETDILFDDLSELETGERYSAASMYHNGLKLCIGSYDELDEVYEYGENFCTSIDGGLILNDFTTSSIEIYVREKDYLKYAYFCIAWTTLSGDDYNCNGDNYVWFAAEPFMSEASETGNIF